MIKIVIGTTPTIIYTFSKIDPSDLVVADLTIEVRKKIVLEKSLSDAVIGEDTLSWTLTQEESLALGLTPGTIMLNWVTSGGTRGVGVLESVRGLDNHKREVL